MLPDGIQPIYAIAGNHILLADGKPKLIGKAYQGKRYLSDGSLAFQDVVEFNFGNRNITDLFFYENDLLIFHSISLYTEAFIINYYNESLEQKKTSPQSLISLVTQKYTLHEMGF